MALSADDAVSSRRIRLEGRDVHPTSVWVRSPATSRPCPGPTAPSPAAFGPGSGRHECWGGNLNRQLGQGDNIYRGDGPNEMGDFLPYIDVW